MDIIDFHTHVFPDSLAERTIPALEKKGNVKAALDGKLLSLIASMERANVSKSVVCSIATKPGQFQSILTWSEKIKSSTIEPFPSFHPKDQNMVQQIRLIHEKGFLGVKLHPFYQNFAIDDESLFIAYEELSRLQMVAMFHTGYDIGFPIADIASPERVGRIKNLFPNLIVIATHVGGWKQWEEAEKCLIGKPIYIDVSFSLQFLPPETAVRMITGHLPDYLLFGSDSPWADQLEAAELLDALKLSRVLKEKIFFHNANKLLTR